MTSDGSLTISYNYNNLPSSIDNGTYTTTYTYDAFGKRVKKYDGTDTTVNIDDLFECVNGACSEYIFLGGQRVAYKVGTQIHYYHTDHLGSTRVLTDETGASAQTFRYSEWGEARGSTGTAKHRFNGKELDAESGLYYYGARYYSTDMARFISPDPMIPDPYSPQSLNRYSYVLNSPYNYTDPSGMAEEGFIDDDVITLVEHFYVASCSGLQGELCVYPGYFVKGQEPTYDEVVDGLKNDLAGCAEKQLGIHSVTGAGAMYLGAPIVKKAAAMGSVDRTSIISVFSRLLFGSARFASSVITPILVPGKDMKWSRTRSVPAALSRWTPVVGMVPLAYDAALILECASWPPMN